MIMALMRPIAYASANLSEAHKNYGITDKEGLAVVWAVRKWRHFLHGSSAVVATDHSSRLWDENQTWNRQKSEFFHIEYR
jgi:hypothetical protein